MCTCLSVCATILHDSNAYSLWKVSWKLLLLLCDSWRAQSVWAYSYNDLDVHSWKYPEVSFLQQCSNTPYNTRPPCPQFNQSVEIYCMKFCFSMRSYTLNTFCYTCSILLQSQQRFCSRSRQFSSCSLKFSNDHHDMLSRFVTCCLDLSPSWSSVKLSYDIWLRYEQDHHS